jgi:DNA-binding MurR/RpiR family transcriptional regulator
MAKAPDVFHETNKHDTGVFLKLREIMPELTPTQKVVCAFILEKYQKIAFVTVEELARQCGASPATVVRTLKALGYGSYREMQEDFERILLDTNVSLWWEMERSWEAENGDFPFPWVAQDNIDAIRSSMTPQLMKNYNESVDLLLKAKTIYIVAMRSSRAASFFFYTMLKDIMPNVACANLGQDVLYDDLVDLTPEDVIFCMSLGGPHHAKATTNAMAYAAAHSIPSILIASSPSNPAAPYASIMLYAPPARKHYSIVACMTLLESLIVSIGKKNNDYARKKLRKLENILLENDITF